MLLPSLLVVVALAVLTFGAEALVRGSVRVARRLGVSSFFIGLTIVGFGTSTPELFTSLVATARGQVDISIGNVVGSNIFNIAFILGLTALVTPIVTRLDAVRSQVWMVLGVAIVPFLALLRGGTLGRAIGAALLAFLVGYVAWGFRAGRREGADGEAAEHALEEEVAGSAGRRLDHPLFATLWIALGLAMLVGGSALLVESAVRLAQGFGVSELVIGLTIVAAGTSAPELFTSFVAAWHRQSDIALGNVLGSNVFNVAGILGLAALMKPQVLSPQVLWLDLPVMVLVSAALLPILATGSRISRVEGAALLLVYAAYLAALLAWAPAAFPG